MDLSSFLIRIILLTIPGITGSLLYRKLRGRVERKDWESYLEIVIFSFLSYTLCSILFGLFDAGEPMATFRALTNESAPIDRRVGVSILFASVLSVPIAVGASYADEYKFINKFGKRIRTTRRFGDEDIWDYLMRSPDIKWVYVRDHKLDLYYYGWIQAWSDPYKDRELLLREVEVFKNSTAELLYKSDVVYLSRNKDDLTIDADLLSNKPDDAQQESQQETSNGDEEKSKLP